MLTNASLRLRQEVGDTYRLAFIGGYFYLAGWLVVAIYGHAFVHSLMASIILTALFLGLAIARRMHRPPSHNSEDFILNKWIMRHWIIVLSSTTLFGLVFVRWRSINKTHPAVCLAMLAPAPAGAFFKAVISCAWRWYMRMVP